MPYGSLSVGCEEQLDPAGTGSFYNEGEADIVVQHVFALIYAGIAIYFFFSSMHGFSVHHKSKTQKLKFRLYCMSAS